MNAVLDTEDVVKKFENSRGYAYLRDVISSNNPTTIEEVVKIVREFDDDRDYWGQHTGVEPGYIIEEFFEGDENLLKSYLEDTLENHQELVVDVKYYIQTDDQDSVIVSSKDVESLEEDPRIKSGFQPSDLPSKLEGLVCFLEPDIDRQCEWGFSEPFLNLPEVLRSYSSDE